MEKCFQAACSPQGWVAHLHFPTALGKGPGASSYHSEGYRLWRQNYHPTGEVLSFVSGLHRFCHCALVRWHYASPKVFRELLPLQFDTSLAVNVSSVLRSGFQKD